MGRKTKRQEQPSEPNELSDSAILLGPARYNVARFLADCSDTTYKFLREQWSEGNQLFAKRVPVDGLPAVVILAGYARQYGVDITDDFDALVERYLENIKDVFHNDKFFASCIARLHQVGQAPDPQAYEDLRVGAIYEELFA